MRLGAIILLSLVSAGVMANMHRLGFGGWVLYLIAVSACMAVIALG